MKIIRIGEPKIIMNNPYSLHNYFGWPTVARLQNGKLAVVASGFRLEHVCPFGKAVISYSEDEGEHYTAPAPVIDTVLDDRDGGILAFGERRDGDLLQQHKKVSTKIRQGTCAGGVSPCLSGSDWR